MLAKVLKFQDAADIVPFSIPTIGDSGPVSKGINQFVVPAFDGTLPEAAFYQDEAFVPENDEEVLRQAREEAARIIAEAEEHGEVIQQAATDKAAHLSDVSFETAVAERVAEIRGELLVSIEKISALSTEVNSRAQEGVVDLALHIAKKIVAREVELDRAIALDLVKASLSKLHNRSIAKVHLNPVDLAHVRPHSENLDFQGTLELIEDSSISTGGCLIHTETGDIDARIESQFDEIAHGLFA